MAKLAVFTAKIHQNAFELGVYNSPPDTLFGWEGHIPHHFLLFIQHFKRLNFHCLDSRPSKHCPGTNSYKSAPVILLSANKYRCCIEPHHNRNTWQIVSNSWEYQRM